MVVVVVVVVVAPGGLTDDATPGRAGRAGPWSAAGRNLTLAPGKPSDDRKSAGDSQQRREAAKQKGRRKAVDSETGLRPGEGGVRGVSRDRWLAVSTTVSER